MNIEYLDGNGDTEILNVEVKLCKNCKYFVGTDAYQGEDIILCDNYLKAVEMDTDCPIPFKMTDYLENGNVCLTEPYVLNEDCQLYKEK